MCGVVNGKIICCRSRGHVGSHATPFPSQRRHGPVWVYWMQGGPFGSCHENDPATHLYCGLEKGHEGDHLSPSNQGPGATLAEWEAAPAVHGTVTTRQGWAGKENIPVTVLEIRVDGTAPPPPSRPASETGMEEITRLVDVLMASVELDGFHSEEEDTPAECRKALLSALSRACEESRRGGIGEALREVNAMKQRNALARDRAAAAGRENVASHRQSDVETCEQIETALRSLASSPGASDPRDAEIERLRAALGNIRRQIAARSGSAGVTDGAAINIIDGMAERALSAASSTPETPPSNPTPSNEDK
jgi:hypothetical protein